MTSDKEGSLGAGTSAGAAGPPGDASFSARSVSRAPSMEARARALALCALLAVLVPRGRGGPGASLPHLAHRRAEKGEGRAGRAPRGALCAQCAQRGAPRSTRAAPQVGT